MDRSYASGVYAALASQPAPDQFQGGEDATDTCAAIDGWADGIQELARTLPPGALPAEVSAVNLARCGPSRPVADVRAAEGWRYTAQDALADAADGELDGSRLAGAQVNTALRVPLVFQGGAAAATLFFSFGATAADLESLFDYSRPGAVRACRRGDTAI